MLLKLLSLLFSKIMFFFGRISGEKVFEKPLTLEEEKECFLLLKNGNKNAEEKLGFTGRKEGISAHSVCLIEK